MGSIFNYMEFVFFGDFGDSIHISRPAVKMNGDYSLCFLGDGFLTRFGSIFQESRLTSANLIVAPRWRTTLAVETNVRGVVMTSSPGPIPKISRANSVAAVQDDSAKAYLE